MVAKLGHAWKRGRMQSTSLLLLAAIFGQTTCWRMGLAQTPAAPTTTADEVQVDKMHAFQIWDRAYNISKQMASPAAKYTAILDALDYARSLERQKPNDINVLLCIGQVYFDRLGNSAEKDYYRRRVREETQARPIAHVARDAVGARRSQMDPLLDSDGHILGSYLAPEATLVRPTTLPAGSEWNTGAELQYLEPYSKDGCFRYGMSPFALAYAYYKRAQVWQSAGNNPHFELSPLIVDSRPPLCLKSWVEEERDRAYGAELRAWGLNVTPETELIKPTAGMPLDKPIIDPQARDEAIYEYALTARICRDGVAEYERHLKTCPFNFDIYQSHMEELRGTEKLALGDHDFLAATAVTGAARQALLDSAARHYQDALAHYQVYLLHYMVDDPIFSQVVPKGCTKTTLAQIPREQLPAILAQVALLKAKLFAHGYDPHGEDAQEFERYIARASQRLVTLGR